MPNTYMPMLVDHKTIRLPTLRKKKQQWKEAKYSCNSLNIHPDPWTMSVTNIFDSLCIWLLVFVRFERMMSKHQVSSRSQSFLERSGLGLSCWYTRMIPRVIPRRPLPGGFREEEGGFVLSLPGLPLWPAGSPLLRGWLCPPKGAAALADPLETEVLLHSAHRISCLLALYFYNLDGYFFV